MVICIMVYHINNEYIAGVFCEIESVVSRRRGAGTGAAAGAALCACTLLIYMKALCASNLGTKEQALRAAAVQTRGVYEPTGRACSGAGNFRAGRRRRGGCGRRVCAPRRSVAPSRRAGAAQPPG